MIRNGTDRPTPANDAGSDFGRELARVNPAGESSLADLIHKDGVALQRQRRLVPLERYLNAIPDLASRPEPLDAALSVVLHSLVLSGTPQPKAIESLSARFPTLAGPIADAAALNAAILSTSGLETRFRDAPERPTPSQIGPNLDHRGRRYELRRRIGFGAFGQVYLALDRLLSEPDHEAFVAVKFIPALGTPETAPAEASKTRRIEHPNVVRVLDSGNDGPDDFIVYEYIDGGTLAEHLQRHPPPLEPRKAAALMSGVARGVQAAHAAGLVHCDLKPSNILLTRDGVPKVTDFGIAVRAHDAARRDRAGDRPPGNLAFISPEQYRSEPGALAPASDVYALGGMLYYLFTGALPNGQSPEEVAATHDPVHGRRAAPELNASRRFDRDIAAICRRALAPDAAHRYASAGQLADDLEAWLRLFPIAWTNPSVWRAGRLFARRQPLAVAALLGWSISLAGAAAGFTLLFRAFSDEARQVRMARDSAMSVRAELPEVITLEVDAIQQFLSDDPATRRFRQSRIDSLRKTIALSAQGGREPLMLWTVQEAKLLVWLLADLRSEEALTLIANSRRRWLAYIPPDDPWIAALDLLADYARIGILYDSTSNGADRDAHISEARRLLDRIAPQESVLRRTSAGSGLHAFALDGLLLLNSRILMDDPESWRSWMELRHQTQAKPVGFRAGSRDHTPSRPGGAP